MDDMIILKSVTFKNHFIPQSKEYPFSIPIIRKFQGLCFNNPITIFVGENGTGKSTLIEAIASAANSITIGRNEINEDPELMKSAKLSEFLQLSWSYRTNKGFFLRSEDFISYRKRLGEIRNDMENDLKSLDEEYRNRSAFSKNLAMLPARRSLYEMKNMYGTDLNKRSHGEGFLDLFRSRLISRGLYILDEPETPLSPMNQFALLSMIYEMTKKDCQFIIATHSPILMALPDADIYSFDTGELAKIKYDDLEHIKFLKSFLNNPEKYLRYLEQTDH
jgi:predicted ATPase